MPSLARILVLMLIAATFAIAQTPPPPESTTMILVPAGEFSMGRQGSTEMPLHRVKVAAFSLDEHEVTNAQYQAFCEATETKLPVFWGLERFRCGDQWPDHPVVGVSRGQAKKYAEWVGKRLPTEAEWEYAARAGSDLRFSSVDTLTTELANYKKSEHKATAPVKSYPPNAWGFYDLVGNVREWTIDLYGAEVPESSILPEDGDLEGLIPVDNPTGPEKCRLGVVKGGGWYSGPSCNAVYVRNGMPKGWGDFNVGFRCAADVAENE